jgi:hypothetical protein
MSFYILFSAAASSWSATEPLLFMIVLPSDIAGFGTMIRPLQPNFARS